jgi:predicted RecA/RadA family phage recombinase
MNVVVKHHDLVIPAVFGSDQPAGTLVFLGDLPAVTLEPIKANVVSGVAVGAVVDGPRETGNNWSQGTVVYWDSANRRFTTTSTGNKRVGVVVGADVVPASATRCLVLMDR